MLSVALGDGVGVRWSPMSDSLVEAFRTLRVALLDAPRRLVGSALPRGRDQ